ncbi:MAG: hypothetical protein NVSMB67_26110 [Flavisolibacter sp.]
MKKYISLLSMAALFISASSFAQKAKKMDVPTAVKIALKTKYPTAKNVTWEKEKGNFEANWGGISGEGNSVQFSPNGDFIEIVKAIAVSQLPKSVKVYVKEHYKGAKITEAGKVTDAQGKMSYEAEVNKKDIIFDEQGNFVREEN